ncbi:MAG: VWA domain-containing protein [Vicinamibacteraceae bacterium]|nr:VWA domain-containing protein [Vicinamibacteraceae bacterium]
MAGTTCAPVLSASRPRRGTRAARRVWPAAALSLLAAHLALAPSSRAQAQAPADPLRSGVDVVTVTVTVRDANGRLVTGLPREAFTVFEDGVEQPVTQFIGDRVPVSLGVVLDVSESMVGERMTDARLALSRFVVDLLGPEDEAFLLVFNHRPRLVAGWTIPPARLDGRLDAVVPTGGTAIYDALLDALPRFRTAQHRRSALVVISDGADTASDATVREVRTHIRREDAFVYAIAVDAPGRRPESGRVQPWALRELTDDSGGYTEIVKGTADLGPATARIAEELNSQYLLGYVPPRGLDGEYHSIRVRTTDPTLLVRARKGYIAEARRRR